MIPPKVQSNYTHETAEKGLFDVIIYTCGSVPVAMYAVLNQYPIRFKKAAPFPEQPGSYIGSLYWFYGKKLVIFVPG